MDDDEVKKLQLFKSINDKITEILNLKFKNEMCSFEEIPNEYNLI
jgi:hypothetical protein